MNIPRSLLSLIAVVVLSNVGCGGGSAAPSAPTPISPTATVTANSPGGLQGASPFAFTVQAANFEAGALTYRWDFGDGDTSAEPGPSHVYNSAGTHTVVVTVSNARQSVRAQTSVTVYGLTGQWATSGGRTLTMQLTQSESAISGQATLENAPGELPYSQCVISGSVQAGAPGTSALILLRQPPCSHPRFGPLVAIDYRLSLVVGGQTIAGTMSSPGRTEQIALHR